MAYSLATAVLAFSKDQSGEIVNILANRKMPTVVWSTKLTGINAELADLPDVLMSA